LFELAETYMITIRLCGLTLRNIRILD